VAHEFVGITKLRIDDLSVVKDDVGMKISAAIFPSFWAISIFSKVLKERLGYLLYKRSAFRIECKNLFAYGWRIDNLIDISKPLKRLRIEMF